MSKDYTYAVARIRARETSLLTAVQLEQLISAGSAEEAMNLLSDKGWGNSDEKVTEENLLNAEVQKTWNLMNELTEDPSELAVLKLTDDYQNLKAAVKLHYTEMNVPKERFFVSGGTIDPEVIYHAVTEKNYEKLPEEMAAAAEEAYDTLVQTGDGQLCDMVLDRAALEAVYKAGEKSGNDLLRAYAAVTVAAADIKIAVRCGRLGKSMEFVQKALAPCRELSVEALAKASLNGVEGISDYLQGTDYASGAEPLRKSMAAFERWCDDLMMEKLQTQKLESFTIGPLAAYVLARQTEIKCVRMILSGKQNGLPEEMMRERLRNMYV